MATQTYVQEMQTIGGNSVQQVQQLASVWLDAGSGSMRHVIPSTTESQQLTTTLPTLYVMPSFSPEDLSSVSRSDSVSSVTSSQESKTIQTIGQTPTQTTIIQPAQGGQQFIVTIAEPAGDHDGLNLQQGGQVVYPAHAQQSYSEYGQPTMYTPVSGTYYPTSNPSNQVSDLQMSGLAGVGNLQGQLLTHQGSTYLLQSGTMDGEGHPLTHTTRASPATINSQDSCRFKLAALSQSNTHNFGKEVEKEVQWLIDNYETAEGVSLPRSTLYNHYLRHCQEQKMDPMNPASFGKLIRSVFLGLRTRRLGTRGNSKYHYYGIRIKASSPLNQFTDDQTMALRQTPTHQPKKFRSGMGRADGSDHSDNSMSQEPPSQQQQHQQFLGDASSAIPNFGSIEIPLGTPLPEGVTMDNIIVFETLYKEHSEAILDVVVNLQFSLIEALWQTFWRNASPDTHQCGDFENRLPKGILYRMSPFEPVQEFVRQSDYAFYQALVEVLIPDVLRPIPSSLTQAIRNFAKSLEGWLKNAMVGVPEEMIKTKVGAVGAFAQTLRRYTSLNHLAQAARAVLQNTSQINQMLTDLNRVDFANVQEQASWVCQCDDAVVHQLEQDFKKTLQQHNSLEQWAVWLEGVVNQVLKQHEGSHNFPKAARQFLLKWSFYSSMVIRDLTLRSAASFGSFHLIRLLYDEYMFYLVEHKVAAASGETPIAVMGEVRARARQGDRLMDLSGMMGMNMMDSSPMQLTLNNTATAAITPLGTSPNSMLNHAGAMAAMIQPTNGAVPCSTPTLLANTPASNSAGTTVTVLTSGSHLGHTPTKTIVVVPVSAAGSGDGPTAKKLKSL